MLELLNARLQAVDLPFTLVLRGVTEDEFDALADEDTRAELLDGDMIVYSPATPRQDDVTGFLVALMRLFAEAEKLGTVLGPQCLVRLAAGRLVTPDAFFFRAKRVPRPLPDKYLDGAPDLAVEILSACSRDVDLKRKRPAYRKAGVRELWLVDLDRRRITVDRRRGARYTTSTVADGWVASSALPGFCIDAAWLWSEPLPELWPCLRQFLR